MNLYFLYNPEDGRVASYSEGSNESTKFHQIKLDVSDSDLILMKQNYDLYIKNNALQCVKPQKVMDNEKNQELEIVKKVFTEKVKSGDVKLADVVEALNKLINLKF